MGNVASEIVTGRRRAVERRWSILRRAAGVRLRARLLCMGGLLAGCGLAMGGCVYDAEDRCSPDQTVAGKGFCVCLPGSVMTATGCVACGENEVATGSACVCAEGFSRPAEGAACEAGPSGLGAACDTAGSACPDPAYALCHATAGSAGYCTEECTSSEDCEGGYACETAATPSYCRRPPVGAGQPCASDADCAGTEAPYCESFMLHQCVVGDCSPAAQDCFSGTQCCDFTQFGAPAPFCLPNGAC